MAKSDKEKVIIDAALKIFSKNGYVNTRMTDIAEEAGLSYGSLYHYYESKDSLFNTIAEDWWTRLFGHFESVKSSTMTTKDKLEAIAKYLLNAYATNQYQLEIYITEISRGFVYHTEPHSKENFLRTFSLCEEIMADGQARGDLRSDISANHLTNIFLGAIDSFLSRLVYGKVLMTAAKEERIIKSIMSTFLHGAMIWY